SKAKGNERKKKIKSLTKSLDNLHAEVARLSIALNQATVLEAEKDKEILRLKVTLPEFVSFFCGQHASEPLSVILHLEPKKLARPVNVPTSRDARVSPPIKKESTVTPASKSLELSSNANLTPFVVASEHNEEIVNAQVDGSDPDMTNDIAAAKVGVCFFHPNDVVVSLSVGEKGDGLVPSFATGKEAAANPSGL
nr:hypothetical protein [Tanacetum cinerariifolium]